MRRAPLLLLVLLCAVGVGIGLRVMLREPSRLQPTAGEWPAVIAGVPQGGVYTGIAEDPANVNPFTCVGAVARRLVLGYTHDCLLDCDPTTGELRGALAASFAPAADGMSCEFTLRAGVRFSDGSPLTMADVLFAWELATGGHLPLSPVLEAFRRVESVTAIDDRRFRVVFREPHYAAVHALGESWIVAKRDFFVERVAAKARLAGVAAPTVGSAEFATMLSQIVRECGPGTGPYELPDDPAAWRTRQDLTLTRNRHCWRREVAPGTWNFAGVRLLFRDPTAVVAALRSRAVDWFSSPSLDAIVAADPSLLADYRQLAYDYRTLGAYLVAWNCRRTPLDLPAVRRALAMLFDLDAVRKAFGDHGTKAKAFARPDSPDYPHEAESPPFDPARARRELRELGYDPEVGHPLKIVLLAPQGLAAMRSTLDLFGDACKQAGVELHVRMLEPSSFFEAKERGDWDAVFLQQSFRPWGDPHEFVTTGALHNHGGWSHPDADAMANAIRAELDPGHRRDLLHELHLLVQREQPVTFLLHPEVTMLLDRQLEGAAPGPLGLSLERAWFVDGAAARSR